MLTSISLENWRSHEKTELRFRKGTNLLVGIMGSGKSSVLDGISFALFGTFPSLEHRKLSLDEIIMHEKESAKIKLGFEWKGEKYEITRELKKTKKDKASSDAEIRKEGKLVEKGQTAVSRYAQQLLQVDYDLFSRAIYSEQNNIDHFLNIDPGKRKEEMDELLGLDRFETARGNAVTILNRGKSARRALEEKFNRARLEEIRKKEQEAQEKCAILEQNRAALSGDAEKNGSVHQQANSRFIELRSKKERYDSIRQDSQRAKGVMDQLREEIGTKDGSEEHLLLAKARKAQEEKSLAGAKKSMLELQMRQNLLSKEAGVLETKLGVAKAAKADLENAGNELESLLAGKKYEELLVQKQGLEQENIKLAGLQQSLSLEIRKLEGEMGKISPTLSRCPLCRCELTKESVVHVLGEYKTEISGMKTQLDGAASQKQQASKSYSELDARLRKAESLVQRQRILEKNAIVGDGLPEQIRTLQSEAASLSESISLSRQNAEKAAASCQQTALECSRLEDLLSKKKKLVQLETALKTSEAELEALKFSEPEFEGARKALEEARFKSEKAQLELNSILLQLKGARDFLALAASERQGMEAIETQINSMLKMEEELSIYKNTLLETQSALRKEVIESINTAMNGIWQLVYPYGDYKGLRITADEKGYAFEMYDRQWRPAELASGGERASMALTFRIALATVLTPNMSLLVLDEPTHNLDKEAVSVLAHALQYNLPELVEQSFIITHDEGLMGSEFASTYKMTRDKDANTPTRTEEI